MKQRVKRPITPAECRQLRHSMSLRVKIVRTLFEMRREIIGEPDPATWAERQFKQ